MLKRKYDAIQQWNATDNDGVFRMLSFSMTSFASVMESSVTPKAAMYGSARSTSLMDLSMSIDSPCNVVYRALLVACISNACLNVLAI